MSMLLKALLAGLALGAVVLTANAQTIPMAVIMPQTGPVATVGGQATRGVIFAVDELNEKGGLRGQKIDLKVEDDQAKPEQSVISFNKLADLSSPPVIFTGFSGPTLALAPLGTRRKIVVVNSAAQGEALAKAPPYLINTIPTVGREIRVLCNWLAEKGKYKKFAILFENASAGLLARDDFRTYCTAAGLTILGEEAAQFGQTDYRPALLKIADMKPDAMLVLLTSGMPQMVQQFGQLGLKFPGIGTSGMLQRDILNDPGSEGWIHTQLVTRIAPDLNDRFKAKYGADMDFFAFEYYNGSQVIFQAMGKVLDEKKPLTGENVRAAIFEISNFTTTPIPTKFVDNSTTAIAEYTINQMTKRQDVVLEAIPVGK